VQEGVIKGRQGTEVCRKLSHLLNEGKTNSYGMEGRHMETRDIKKKQLRKERRKGFCQTWLREMRQ